MTLQKDIRAKLTPSFWTLNVTQFLSAMNDNAFRFLLGLALVGHFSDPAVGQQEWPIYVAGLVFALPFILFSSAAGILADRFSKSRLIVIVNAVAVGAMLLAIPAFLSNSAILLYLVLFLMLTHSAFFTPCKLGILPEIVPRERISQANGLMEMFTNMAIILGSILGPWLYGRFGEPKSVAYASTASCWRGVALCAGVSVVAFVLCLLIRPTAPCATVAKRVNVRFWEDVLRNLRKYRSHQYLFLAVLAIGFFLFMGMYVQMNVLSYGRVVLDLDKEKASYLYLMLAVGIGVGSYLVGVGSGRVVEIGFIPVGALIVAASLMLLAVPVQTVWYAVFLLFLMGVGGGFFIVPLYAFLQEEAPEEDRGELIATANFLSFCGVLLASVLMLLLDNVLGVPPTVRFFLLGAVMLGLTGYVVWLLPDFLIRFFVLVLTRTLYKVEAFGLENVPMTGPALIVCNHMSYIDAALVGSTHQRRVRFLMAREFYEHPWFQWLFRLIQAIPVAPDDSPKEIARALRTARQAMDDGYLVCIFAEGALTRTGATMEFKRGLERIVRNSDYPIIPTCLHGVWGSTFSYSNGRTTTRVMRLRRRVSVVFGNPMPSTTKAFEVRTRVMELYSDLCEYDRTRHHSLPEEFATVARSSWRRFCMTDSLGRDLTFGETLTGSLALADALQPRVNGQKNVGILLPNSVAGALTNLAVGFLGKVAVNLNYTSSRTAVEAAIRQAELSTIITSKRFIERVGYEGLEGCLYIEDLLRVITPARKAWAFLKALVCPVRFLVRRSAAEERDQPKVEVDEVATILFSSGSTGDPKGVMLSHYNILSNVQAVQQMLQFNREDVLCGVLPFFHSMGLTITLYLPILVGIGVAYHPNPLEAAAIGTLSKKYRCSILVATPSFLMLYTRKILPEQFHALRLVIVGAEKLKRRVAQAFEHRFGVEPYEGYGTTELSPVAGLNLTDVEMGGVKQVANKPGTIGRPLPGVTVRVVDPDNLDCDLGYEKEGLLLVKGPNVMKGYLKNPEGTARVIHNGWYITGDIAEIHHDGFVRITDRLSRFSKIAGEMVPHIAVEEKIQECVGQTEQVCAVTSVPDEKKGERLVVFLTADAGDPAEVHRMLRESGLPNLWLPNPNAYHVVEALPLLGSGKMDLRALKKMAADLETSGGEEATPPAGEPENSTPQTNQTDQTDRTE
jgi:acyl-[acyl-carrier-protein]-phospholipid O-acyltransferase/long-chain-fatty-acid--[acyl-carrier-protein] ligase